MKGRSGWRLVALCLVLMAGGMCEVAAAQVPARLEGRVTAPGGRAVEGVRVTLLNDGYSPLRSVYTDAAGRFQFSLSQGAYYVEVEPESLPYKRQQQRVEINPSPFSKIGELFRVDIQLVPIERGEKPNTTDTKVVFAQEVPKPAKDEFDRGTKLLKDGKADDAYAAFQKAIELFPDYYDAMETLGTEYVKADKLNEAYPVLSRAIVVNPSGDKAHYALGVLYYKSGHHTEAVQEFTRADELAPNSRNTLIYLGLSLMRAGNTAEAEMRLKKAYDMGARNVPDLHLALASIYMKNDRPGDAATELQRLLDETPGLKDRKKIEDLIESLKKKAKEK